MYSFLFKISALSFVLLCNALFGMERSTILTEYEKPHTILPFDLMIGFAAGGSGEVKNNIKRTCQFFNKSFTKDNIAFISHPAFTAHEKDVRDMLCSAAWFNNVQKEKALKPLANRYGINTISFTTMFKPNSLRPIASIGVSVNDIKLLRNKYNHDNDMVLTDYEISWEIEPAFYCAVWCNDFEAINNIAPKIKLCSYSEVQKMAIHNCLLLQIIQKDREELFEVVVNSDPVGALNVYSNLTADLNYQCPFLDLLISADYISQDLKDKYSGIYRECGGKTFQDSLLSDVQGYLIDFLDNPITFGQTNKENHKLVKALGLQNIRLAYAKNDPKFVLDHYVPILPVRSRICGKDTYRFGIISPYCKTFYSLEDDLGEDIRSLGEKRLQQFIDQKKIQYKNVIGNLYSRPSVVNNPLSLVAIFGTKEDVENKLKSIETLTVYAFDYNDLLYAMHACIDNSDINRDNNNGLKVLFQDSRALYVNDDKRTKGRGQHYYQLLDLARQAKNKKAFEIFVTQDIHNSKNIPWVNVDSCQSLEDFESMTALDLVIEHNEKCAEWNTDPFSAEDIALLKKHGAKTAEELLGKRITKELPEMQPEDGICIIS